MALKNLDPAAVKASAVIAYGHLTGSQGAALLAKLPHCSLGDICEISRSGQEPLLAEVIAFNNDLVQLAPFDDTTGVSPGALIKNKHSCCQISLPGKLRGSIINPFGIPLDRQIDPDDSESSIYRPIYNSPPNPTSRRPITTQLVTGISLIDTLCPLGIGQRVALIAEPGVGKSTLLGMIARNAEVDITIIALVGERGREVSEFVTDCLGVDGMQKSVMVVATSDETPLRRKSALLSATAIAEHYRTQGKTVLLLVDSLTRYARAVREIALSAGELPVRHGYPASLFTQLPKALERAGTGSRGSITAIYSLLSNGSLEPDPLADEVKSLLDGHLILTDALARQGLRPAIDPNRSISRLANRIQTEAERTRAGKIKNMLERLNRDREIILFGGTPDPELQIFLKHEPHLYSILHQKQSGRSDIVRVHTQLKALLETIESELQLQQQPTMDSQHDLAYAGNTKITDKNNAVSLTGRMIGLSPQAK